MCWRDVWSTYLAPMTPVIAAILALVFGRHVYFRQKEFEIITARYLTEGVDAVSESVDSSLRLFRYNWWQATVLLKHFRDLGKDIRPELYRDIFISPTPDAFELWRDYRIHDLIRAGVIFRARQKLDAFIRSSYAFFQDDLGAMVRITVEGGKELEVKASRQEMVDSYVAQIDKLDQEAHQFYDLLGELQNLSGVLQTERFSFRKLSSLYERQQVRDIVARLEARFGPDPVVGRKAT